MGWAKRSVQRSGGDGVGQAQRITDNGAMGWAKRSVLQITGRWGGEWNPGGCCDEQS